MSNFEADEEGNEMKLLAQKDEDEIMLETVVIDKQSNQEENKEEEKGYDYNINENVNAMYNEFINSLGNNQGWLSREYSFNSTKNLFKTLVNIERKEGNISLGFKALTKMSMVVADGSTGFLAIVAARLDAHSHMIFRNEDD